MRNWMWMSAATLLSVSAASAATIVWTTSMSGPNEAPPNASPGVGSATVTIDDVANTMRVQATFSGLIGNTTAAHIHGPTATPGVGTAPVMTQLPSFSGFPLGVTFGSMDNTFDLTLASSYSAAFIAANGGTPASAMIALMANMDAGRAYFNIHSSSFTGGEIRGFMTRIPEPASLSLLALAGLTLFRRR